MRRILSMWLPNWPIQRLRRLGVGAPDKPLATVASQGGVRILAAVDPPGKGLQAGQTLAQARAIAPGLDAMEADPASDQAGLIALAGWCMGFTPLAAADVPDGLWLDITGCAHLFGGEAGLVAALARRLDRAGLACCLAVAGTPGAAWALARFARSQADPVILAPGDEARALARLPLAALRLAAQDLARLRHVGLRQVGALARQPRDEITTRFGAGTVLRLDQALGRASEAIAWLRPPCPWRERLDFAEPIGTPEDLARALAHLAQRLCARLEATRRGGHGFAAWFFRLDATHARIAIATAQPVHAAAYVAKLLCARLETVDPGCGIEAIVLEAEAIAPAPIPQTGLATLGPAAEATGFAETIDTLANRLGIAHLWRDVPFPSHVPERATRRVMPLAAGQAAWPAAALERPLRLFPRPEPITATALLPDDPPMHFTWRGVLHHVRAANGPERVGAEWWRNPPDEVRGDSDKLRDYYQVEDDAGARFWVFRAGAAGVPRWFLHGVFG